MARIAREAVITPTPRKRVIAAKPVGRIMTFRAGQVIRPFGWAGGIFGRCKLDRAAVGGGNHGGDHLGSA